MTVGETIIVKYLFADNIVKVAELERVANIQESLDPGMLNRKWTVIGRPRSSVFTIFVLGIGQASKTHPVFGAGRLSRSKVVEQHHPSEYALGVWKLVHSTGGQMAQRCDRNGLRNTVWLIWFRPLDGIVGDVLLGEDGSGARGMAKTILGNIIVRHANGREV